MWTINESEAALRTLSAIHIQEGAVDLEGLVDALADFYYDNRIKRYKKEEDRDLILSEYGTFDFGQGKWFQWSFTRQFYKPTAIQQLHLNLFYDPTIVALKELGTANFWNDAASKEAWIKQVKETVAFKEIQKHALINYEIKLGRV